MFGGEKRRRIRLTVEQTHLREKTEKPHSFISQHRDELFQCLEVSIWGMARD